MVDVQYSSNSEPIYSRRGRFVKGDLNSSSSKISGFGLVFDNDDTAQPSLYISGTKLSGHVLLDVVKPTSIVRIRVICEGFLRIADTKKTLISSNQVLFGCFDKGRKTPTKCSAGRYKYPFQVDLDSDLPTTIFSSPDLKVFYRCTAFLIRKSVSDDLALERTFIVHNVTPSVYEQLSLGQEYAEKSISFSEMNAIVTLPKTGLFLGDCLTVSGIVHNPLNNSRKVKVGLSIIRTLVGRGSREIGFIKLDKTKRHIAAVTNRWSKFFKVPKKSSEEFEVEVPLIHLEPTANHDLISIEYSAKVSFVYQGLINDSTPKSVMFPITIAPPRSLAQYPTNYSTEAPVYTQPFTSENNLNSAPSSSSHLYPSLLLEGEAIVPSAPELEESDEDNEKVVLPTYEDVISGRV